MECVCSFVWEGKDKGRKAAERKKERKKEGNDHLGARSSIHPSHLVSILPAAALYHVANALRYHRV